MKPRDIAFAGIGVILAATFISLGIWQLDRLGQRREFNRALRSRAETPPVAVAAVPADTGAARYTRVALTGSYDFSSEIVITSRSRNGSPGVNIITPVKVPGNDTAILVNRGWVYAPDGMTVDLRRWREPDAVEGEAYVENFSNRTGEVRATRIPNAYRWMDRPALSQAFPYPIAPFYLVLIGETQTPPADVPPRVPVPPLDEGSHRSYAFQWFSFAAISIIGILLYLRRK